MSCRRYAVLLAVTLVLPAPPGALAHGTSQHGTQAPSETGPARAPDAELDVTVDPEAATAPVIQVRRGAHVHLSIAGAGAHPLHLHGYDIAVRGTAEAPVTLVFNADHAGRFPVEMHVEDDLLGPREKPVLYIEVRGE